MDGGLPGSKGAMVSVSSTSVGVTLKSPILYPRALNKSERLITSTLHLAPNPLLATISLSLSGLT